MRFSTATHHLIYPVALVVLIVGLPSNPVHAENRCHEGFMPWRIPIESANDCVQIPGYNDHEEPRAPSGRVWATRWGAIAIGDTSSGGGVGAAGDMKSENAARKSAIKKCQATDGGESCKSGIFTYYNECAVVAWGSNGYAIRSANMLGLAGEAALSSCSQLYKECKIFYSDCSLPVRTR